MVPGNDAERKRKVDETIPVLDAFHLKHVVRLKFEGEEGGAAVNCSFLSSNVATIFTKKVLVKGNQSNQ